MTTTCRFVQKNQFSILHAKKYDKNLFVFIEDDNAKFYDRIKLMKSISFILKNVDICVHNNEYLVKIIQEKLGENNEYPNWVFLSSIFINETQIKCCTAGSFRVYLVKYNNLVAVTNSHTISFESHLHDIDKLKNENPQLYQETITLLSSTPTRYIGWGQTNPPEFTTWQSPPKPYEILIASQGAHKNMDPTNHIEALLKKHDEISENGLFLKITFPSQEELNLPWERC